MPGWHDDKTGHGAVPLRHDHGVIGRNLDSLIQPEVYRKTYVSSSSSQEPMELHRAGWVNVQPACLWAPNTEE